MRWSQRRVPVGLTAVSVKAEQLVFRISPDQNHIIVAICKLLGKAKGSIKLFAGLINLPI